MNSCILILLIAGYIEAKTLYFDSTNTLCPDKQGTCPEETTCCILPNGRYGCCPLPEAVCCSDHLHCCPNGYTCDVPDEKCIQANGETVSWSVKTEAISSIDDKSAPVLCPDGQSQCPDGSTCCQLSSGQWGCCPLVQAVCCSDHLHCCPSGTTCDVPEEKCNKANGESISWSIKTSAISVKRKSETVVCPDGQSQCPDSTTCCQLSSGQWGCCPLVQAVCCSDHLHCCPSGTTCDVPEQKCNKANGESVLWSIKTSAISANHKSENIVCPDGQSQCPDGTTCCQLSSGQWGCCPLVQAVCCSDHLHCCPSGTTCDVPEQKCNQANGESVSWSVKTAASRPFESVVCPDGQSECADGQTCCSLASGDWGCCPLPQAVCCSDHLHCCPSGTTCDVTESQCNRANGESIPWLDKTTATSMKRKFETVPCPDGQSECPDDSTCCQLSSGQWACCPLVQAVCCSDHLHCCPSGTTCDVTEEKCNQGNGESVSWSIKTPAISVNQKSETVICPDGQSQCPDDSTCCQLTTGEWGCCPLVQAVCCSDHLHCCPSGTTCDVPHQKCNRANGESLPWAEKTESTLVKLNVETILCPDGGECPDGSTCCQLSSVQWGCCPLVQAVCCSDHLHCCPNGTTCDVPEQKCNQANGESISWSIKTSAISAKRKSATVLCPDGQSQCPDGTTCCQLSSGQWGCCPLVQAVCCSDHLHCCPSGTTCDVPHQKCNQENGESVAWSDKIEATLVHVSKILPALHNDDTVNNIVCPDGKVCIGDDTCCLSSSGFYGCCPLPKLKVVPLTSNDNDHATPKYIVCPDYKKICNDDETCCKKSTSYGCCPLPQASCCADLLHCCPHGYTCNTAQGTCTKGDIISIPWSTRIASTPAPGVVSLCPDGKTSCRLTGGPNGCCSFENGVCCSDGLHCCPSETTCDAETGMCQSNKLNMAVGWELVARTKGPFMKSQSKSDVVCPDGKSQCPSDTTCCQMQNGLYGCCPFPEATCCEDKLHCCPKGMKCDVAHSTCVGDNSRVVLPWEAFGRRRPKMIKPIVATNNNL